MDGVWRSPGKGERNAGKFNVIRNELCVVKSPSKSLDSQKGNVAGKMKKGM